VSLLVGGFQETSNVSTLPYHILSRGCFTSFWVVWDIGIIFPFSLDHSMEHQFIMEFIEDNKSLGTKDFSCPHFWNPLLDSFNDFCGLSVKRNGVKRGYLMSLS